jgi:hypothetical protein
MSHVVPEWGITSIQFAFWFGPVGGFGSGARGVQRRAALDAFSGRCFFS